MDQQSTILIVDDEEIVRETLGALLHAPEYTLEYASNGIEALQKATELAPDLVLLDVMMPGMDGFEVCRRVRATPMLAEVPIIMVTALDDRASRLRGIEAGADDFITKPVDRVELVTRVRTITRLNRYRRLMQERARRHEAEAEIHRLYQEVQQHAANLEHEVAERTLELEWEHDRTQAILEALGEAVVVTDVGGIIQYANPATETLTGYSEQELMGRSWDLWQSEELSAWIDDVLRQITASGLAWRGQVVNRNKSGSLYDVAITVAPLLDPKASDQPLGFVGVLRDITPIKEAERLKDQFVSNVSHELRTPLSVIALHSGNLENLYEQLTEGKRLKMVGEIRDQVRVLDTLIGDVLEISRIDSGRISTARDRFDLAQSVLEEVQEQEPLARKEGQTMTVTTDEGAFVWGNGRQVRRVVRNLVYNAIKYAGKGGAITCEVKVAPGNGNGWSEGWPGSDRLSSRTWVGFRVTDTGIGIDEEDFPRLFECFYRGKTQGNVRGTGLGLSIAQELAELHGGFIAASSKLGAGSTFAVYLPRVEEDAK